MGLARRKLVNYKGVFKVAGGAERGYQMSQKSRIVSVLIACSAAALATAASPANATVYNVNRTIDGGSVVGTVTTDGATGTIDPSDFTAWNLVLTGPGSTMTISSNDAAHAVYGSGVDITASATQISFNFSASDGGFLVFQQVMNSGQTYWCVNSDSGTCKDNESVVPQGFMDTSAQFADREGTQVIATAAGAVPEPATWALMLLGFAGLGYAGFRQNRTRSAATA
jgi:PEP-CTERM motif